MNSQSILKIIKYNLLTTCFLLYHFSCFDLAYMLLLDKNFMEIKVLFVDDHELLREAMQDIIEHIGSDLKLIGVAANGKEALDFVNNQKPDVIIMDIDMPVMNGIDATREINSHYPDVGIIGYSMCGERWRVEDMVEAGAKGYLVKTATLEELNDAIQKVFKGEYFFTKDVAKYFPLQ